MSPSDAQQTLRRLAETIPTANAVGDLAGLNARVGNLVPLAEERKQDAERARNQARERRRGRPHHPGRRGRADRRDRPGRDALEDGRRPPAASCSRTGSRSSASRRLDKHTEDELWRRFSHARTAFDRKRRQYFGALDEQRAGARSVKEDLVAEAEALSTSTDWGRRPSPTAT